eukprot:2793477-Rhodomonas_salina.2
MGGGAAMSRRGSMVASRRGSQVTRAWSRGAARERVFAAGVARHRHAPRRPSRALSRGAGRRHLPVTDIRVIRSLPVS